MELVPVCKKTSLSRKQCMIEVKFLWNTKLFLLLRAILFFSYALHLDVLCFSFESLALLHMLNLCALCNYVVLLSTNKILIITIGSWVRPPRVHHWKLSSEPSSGNTIPIYVVFVHWLASDWEWHWAHISPTRWIIFTHRSTHYHSRSSLLSFRCFSFSSHFSMWQNIDEKM